MRIAFTLSATLLLILAACPSKPAPAPQEKQPALVETTAAAPAAPESTPPAPAKAKTTPATPSADTPESVKPPADTTEAAGLPKLWDFFATWCPPCKEQAPIIEELMEEYKGRIEIVSIDTDRNPALAEKFKVKAIPTLVFLDPDQRELSRNVGLMTKDRIVARFREHGFIQ